MDVIVPVMVVAMVVIVVMGMAVVMAASTGVIVAVVMPVIVTMCMVVVVMVVPMVMGRPVHLHLAVTASANRTHHAASKSLILISSPPCGISFPPPHSGQQSSRCSISTVFMQS